VPPHRIKTKESKRDRLFEFDLRKYANETVFIIFSMVAQGLKDTKIAFILIFFDFMTTITSIFYLFGCSGNLLNNT
jgi:hypothetical protein